MKKQPVRLRDDRYLAPYRKELDERAAYIRNRWARLEGRTDWHEVFGLHRCGDGSWRFREWLPNATAVWLVGVFNDWQLRDGYRLKRVDGGVWEVRLEAGQLAHGDVYGMHVEWPGGSGYRLPSAATRVVRQEDHVNEYGVSFNAQVWTPPEPYVWRHGRPKSARPLIYESHVGMATEQERVGTYRDYARDVLPRIAKAGYNTVQLMGIQQHPFYGSFGYHVSSFFSLCDLYGTPEEFKDLVDTAHGLGLRVIIDLVHSHSVKNETEGLGCQDGTPWLYFHDGARGYHPAWDSRCFDYGKDEVCRFLLSNCRFWLEEYRLDGFRFDGVTSMIYRDHGLGRVFGSYGDYFSLNTDWDALAYLGMANRVIHDVLPDAVTIAEDVSGMPGLASPWEAGGVGFDYRLSMGVPDLWFKLADGMADEDWPMGELWHELNNHRAEEQCLSYVECHDQALVGGKTFLFTLVDAAMYDSMHATSQSLTVERGVALHKMSRLVTLATADCGYLNFMGNEFGHPEWIDFPRPGNGWSYAHALRKWSLRDDASLRFKALGDFDEAMLSMVKGIPAFFDSAAQLIVCREDEKLLVFERADVLFAFNFHPTKPQPALAVMVPPGIYRPLLDTDDVAFGGHGLIGGGWETWAVPVIEETDENWYVTLNLPPRTALALRRIIPETGVEKKHTGIVNGQNIEGKKDMSKSSHYMSTRGGVAGLDFKAAVMMGLADDGGLLLPEAIPQIDGETLTHWSRLSYPELAFEVMAPFIGDAVPAEDLRALVKRSYATFAAPDVIPVKHVGDVFITELFHGPTLAFKDVALQFLGNMFEYILKQTGGKLNILGATSGDTGSAAIHGVRGKAGIDIFIMFPDGRVSPLQERQMTTVPDDNVHCIAVEGTFDDGQRVLKEVFNDLPFKRDYHLGAVNSVNWCRVLAQVVYYFWSAFRVQEATGCQDVQVTVPTGNFGDIFAGYVALRMGAPIRRLVLATNENDILSRFFNTGVYSRGAVCPTLSPSMDIQVASNFERYLYYRVGQDAAKVRELMKGFAAGEDITLADGGDSQFAAGRGDTAMTLAAIAHYYKEYGYILDPHTAVGVAVAEKNLLADVPMVCLSTAHPAKFASAIRQALGDDLAHHPTLEALKTLPVRRVTLKPEKAVIEGYMTRELSK